MSHTYPIYEAAERPKLRQKAFSAFISSGVFFCLKSLMCLSLANCAARRKQIFPWLGIGPAHGRQSGLTTLKASRSKTFPKKLTKIHPCHWCHWSIHCRQFSDFIFYLLAINDKRIFTHFTKNPKIKGMARSLPFLLFYQLFTAARD